MISRDLTIKIKDIALKMPVISITGPRQSGKTTLARFCFPGYDYVNLEDPRQREFAISDPTGFFNRFKNNRGVIFDEPQHVPDLFSYIQVISDESGQAGKFVITGSQHFLLQERITQTLAGRVAIFHLPPLSISELKGAGILPGKYESLLLHGFYPRIYDKGIEPTDFYSYYLQSYIERDVRQMRNVGDLHIFQKLIRLCAGRTGQLVNYSSLGNDCGMDQKTMKQWISVLEAGFIIFFLQPYSKSFNKRTVRTPKLYFYDTGLACYLLGINNIAELQNNFYKGALFENMIIAEMMKNRLNKGVRPNMFFWRDNTGNEIDCIIEEGNALKAIEIKSAMTVTPDFLKGLEQFREISSSQKVITSLIYGGNESQNRSNTQVICWKDYV